MTNVRRQIKNAQPMVKHLVLLLMLALNIQLKKLVKLMLQVHLMTQTITLTGVCKWDDATSTCAD